MDRSWLAEIKNSPSQCKNVMGRWWAWFDTLDDTWAVVSVVCSVKKSISPLNLEAINLSNQTRGGRVKYIVVAR